MTPQSTCLIWAGKRQILLSIEALAVCPVGDTRRNVNCLASPMGEACKRLLMHGRRTDDKSGPGSGAFGKPHAGCVSSREPGTSVGTSNGVLHGWARGLS